MGKKKLTWRIVLFTTFVLLPASTVVLAVPVFYDYVGNTGNLGGTYIGFIQFNAPAQTSFTFESIGSSHDPQQWSSVIHPQHVMPDGRQRASIFALQNLPHKNPQRRMNHSEQSGRWEEV